MDVILERCAALDIAKKTVAVCLYVRGRQQSRTFSTMTKDLLELVDWLATHRVTHVAITSRWSPPVSTGSLFTTCWRATTSNSCWRVRASSRRCPDALADAGDAEWLADLLRHGLLRASFVPERAHRELRELVRYRKMLVEERTRELNRIEKVLEGANIKVSAVVSTVASKGVRDMLRALIAGETDTAELAELARGRMRSGAGRAGAGPAGHDRSAPAVPAGAYRSSEQLGHLDEIEGRDPSGSATRWPGAWTLSRTRCGGWRRSRAWAGNSLRWSSRRSVST